MRKIAFAFTALLIGLYAPTVSSQIVSPEAIASRQAAAQTFLTEHGPQWAVRLSDETGTPLSIFIERPLTGIGEGRASIAVSGATPEAKALRFFGRYATLFGLESEAGEVFDVMSVRSDDGQTHVRLRQVYGGVPVFGGDYNVTFDATGRVVMVSGRYFPEIDLDTSPSILPAVAVQSAVNEIGLTRTVGGLLGEPTADLVVFPYEKAYELVYRVLIEQKDPPIVWEVFVDAESGEVIKVEDVTFYLDGHSDAAKPTTHRSMPTGSQRNASFVATGTGSVFADNGGDGSTVTRSLRFLVGSGYTLDGTYVEALNDDTGEAYSSSSQFFYSPSDTHFDEVNVYYHLTEFAAWLPSAGFPGIGYTIPAKVHYGTNWGNAAFSPSAQELRFGDGDGVYFRDLAKENDIAYHEYTHAVVYHLGITQLYGEPRSIHEGTADYFAASFSGNPRMGEWTTLCTDTGDLRRVDTPASVYRYGQRNTVNYAYCESLPDDYWQPAGSDYLIGMIWSGALWDTRSEIGTTADALVIEALESLGSAPSLIQGRDAMIAADNAINGGANVCDIRKAFADRDLGTACPPPFIATISGPSVLGYKQSGQWSASYSGGTSSGTPTYHWYSRNVGSSTWIDAHFYGQTYTQTMFTTSFELRVDITRGTDTGTDYHTVYYDDGGALRAGSPGAIPEVFALHGAAPNPVHDAADVHFDLPEEAHVRLVVYDVMGREVAQIVDETRGPGAHTARFEASALPSGVYIVRMTADGASGLFQKTQRLTVVR